MLRLGVEGKAAGWRTLRVLAETDKRLDACRLDEPIARARRQADLLEELRVRAAGQVIGFGATADISTSDIATPLRDPVRIRVLAGSCLLPERFLGYRQNR